MIIHHPSVTLARTVPTTQSLNLALKLGLVLLSVVLHISALLCAAMLG